MLPDSNKRIPEPEDQAVNSGDRPFSRVNAHDKSLGSDHQTIDASLDARQEALIATGKSRRSRLLRLIARLIAMDLADEGQDRSN